MKKEDKSCLARRLHHCLMYFRALAPAVIRQGRGKRRKMMMATEKLFGLHATALQLRSQRMMLLASNIANAARKSSTRMPAAPTVMRRYLLRIPAAADAST